MAKKPTPKAMPWEKQACDTEDSWECFVAYRDQSYPRRFFLTPATGRFFDPVQVKQWAQANNWAERVEAYDKFLDDERIAARLALEKQTVGEIATEHMIVLGNARELIQREISKRLKQSAGSLLETMTAKELATFVDLVIKHDRLIRGESTEKIDTGVDLSKLSKEELAALYEIRKKLDKEPVSD